MTGWVWL